MTLKIYQTQQPAASIALLLILSFASAASADLNKEAKDAFMAGVEAFGKEDYPGALANFEKSYDLKPKASVLYNIGMCQKALYRYSESIKTFRNYLEKAGAIAKPDLKIEVKKAIEEMMQLVSRLDIIEAPNEADVLINGKFIGKTPLKEEVLLDPGRHTIEIVKEGFDSLKTDITSVSGAVVSIRAALAKAKARLKVECAEEKGLVSVDGKTVGGCPYDGEIEPGIRKIGIEAPEKKTYETKIEAISGSTSIVSATLEPIAQTGTTITPATQPPPTQTALTSPPKSIKPVRQAWQDLTIKVTNTSLDQKERIAAINEFLATYTVAAKYLERIQGWKANLEAGVEPESYEDANYMRTKKEKFAIRLFLGNYGGGLRLELPTRRWNWFYMGSFFSGGGGFSTDQFRANNRRYWGSLGFTLGVPFSIGRKNHHEIRAGLGLAFGVMFDYSFTDTDGDKKSIDVTGISLPFILAPEIYYVWHISKSFALQAGAEMHIGPTTPEHFDMATTQELYYMAFPVINGFLGFRF